MSEETSSPKPSKLMAPPIGRILRFLVGASLILLAAFAYLAADGRAILLSLCWAVGLVVLYGLIHSVVSTLFRTLNRWVGAVLALAPVIAVYLLGGPATLGALTFLGVSLLLASLLGDPGCEVMTLPGLVFRRRTHLVCLLFSPIDWAEEKLRQKN
jgi:hypothetical protein